MATLSPCRIERLIWSRITSGPAAVETCLQRSNDCTIGVTVGSFMRRLFLSLLVLFLPATVQSAGLPVIVVLGDSLSAGYGIDHTLGWVSLLQKRLSDEGYPHQVINASISGDTTRGGAARISAVLERNNPSLVVVGLGGNDGLRGIGLGEMEKNLTQIVISIKESQAIPLLVGVRLPPNYGVTYTEQFQSVFKSVADQSGASLVPKLMEGVASDLDLMQTDGIHPLAEVQSQLLNNVWSVLGPLLE